MPWRRGNFPIVSDKVIQEKLKAEKNNYQNAVHYKGRTTEEEGNAYSTKLESSTFNIVLPAWRELVQADRQRDRQADRRWQQGRFWPGPRRLRS